MEKCELYLHKNQLSSYGMSNFVLLGFGLGMCLTSPLFLFHHGMIQYLFPVLLFTGVLTAAQNHSVVQTLLSILFNRPYLVFDEAGIEINGGIFDYWFFAWSDIAAFSPFAEFFDKNLQELANVDHSPGSNFLDFTLKVPAFKKRRWLSDVQNSRYNDLFEIHGYFNPVRKKTAQEIIQLVETKIKRFDLIVFDR